MSAERNALIIARFEAGETLQVIGAAFGITRERVRQIVKRAGGKPRLVQARERRDALAQALREGNYSSEEAAAKFGVARSTVTNLAAECGIALRVDHVYDAPEYAAMAELVRGGMSMHKAAGGVNKVEARLADYCNAHGIVSLHGRWRARTERASIIKSMRLAGASWETIAIAVSACEGYQSGGAAMAQWAVRHLSQADYRLVNPPRPASPRPPRTGKGRGPRQPVAVCDEIREAARQNYGKAPASEIAKAHGVTRNVIIGHWFRLRRAGLLPIHSVAA